MPFPWNSVFVSVFSMLMRDDDADAVSSSSLTCLIGVKYSSSAPHGREKQLTNRSILLPQSSSAT